MENQLDYLVVGAGPAGLQLAHHLSNNGRSYLVVESGSTPGLFFTKFPRHRKLISINKIYTGSSDPEFNLRMDWNSILSQDDDFRFTRYSDQYFPRADDMVRYLSDFASHHNLSIRLRCRIVRIERRQDGFVAVDQAGREYTAKYVIVATGVSLENVPDIPGAEFAETYGAASVDPQEYINKRVLIIGKGNSAFEVADNLIGTASAIHIVGPKPVQLAWRSHFVGHLRAVNNNFLDTYQLKSQNSILDATVGLIDRNPSGYKVQFKFSKSTIQHSYDRVILCTGFRFDTSIFAPDCRPNTTIDDRFPALTPGYRSENVPGLYFAGTITQSLDFKRSTGGFIHGFRYGVRALSRVLEQELHGRSWPEHPVDLGSEGLTSAILERINRSSGLWQQFGELADIIDLSIPERGRRFEEVPVGYVYSLLGQPRSNALMITLEYGPGHHMFDPFCPRMSHAAVAKHDSSEADCYLHAVIRHYHHGQLVGTHHMRDALENDWVDPDLHVKPLRAFIEDVLLKA